jgi:hypothetical protein
MVLPRLYPKPISVAFSMVNHSRRLVGIQPVAIQKG